MGALGGLNASSGPTAPTLCPGSRGHSSRLELRRAARVLSRTDIAHDSIDSQDIAIVIESLYRDIGTSRAAFSGFHLQEPERIQPIIGYRVLRLVEVDAFGTRRT